ncbi:hypothetical protein BJ684DRAFT_16530, partial [Piptocephalis cylindrospora]
MSPDVLVTEEGISILDRLAGLMGPLEAYMTAALCATLDAPAGLTHPASYTYGRFEDLARPLIPELTYRATGCFGDSEPTRALFSRAARHCRHLFWSYDALLDIGSAHASSWALYKVRQVDWPLSVLEGLNSIDLRAARAQEIHDMLRDIQRDLRERPILPSYRPKGSVCLVVEAYELDIPALPMGSSTSSQTAEEPLNTTHSSSTELIPPGSARIPRPTKLDPPSVSSLSIATQADIPAGQATFASPIDLFDSSP